MPTMITEGSSNGVMMDIAEWWCHALLRQTDPSKWDALESVLPHVTPIDAHTSLATRLRACALWQEVLWIEKGDFSMLQDKLLLLAKEFNRNNDADYLQVLDVLKVQEQLASLYQGLLESSTSGEDANGANDTLHQTTLLDSYQSDIQGLFGGVTHVPEALKALTTTTTIEEDSNPATIIRQRIEHLIKEEDGSYSYAQLQSKMQTLLLGWCETSLEIPELVRLGYRGVTTSQQQQQQENESQEDKDQAAAIESNTARSKTARSKTARSKTTTRDADDDEQEMEEQVDGRKEPDDEEEEEEEEESDESDWDPTKKVTSDDASEETEMAPPGNSNLRSELSFESSDAEPSRNAKKKGHPSSPIPRRSPVKRKRHRSSPLVPRYQRNTPRRQSLSVVWPDDSSSDDDENDDDDFAVQPPRRRRRRRTMSPQRTTSIPRRHPTPQQVSRSASSKGSSRGIRVGKIISSPTGTPRKKRSWTLDETAGE
jgi:hypothetical protein